MVPKVHRALTPSANQGLLQPPKIHPLLFPLPPGLGRGSIDFVASNQDSEDSVTKAMAANQEVPAPVKILRGYLQWYDISSELIPSDF